ncbi:MAG: flagellar biosynthesis anti-sigma factor FlgM [Acidobacteriota bacterium]
MTPDNAHPNGEYVDAPSETPEERALRVAEIKRKVALGRYRVDGKEILYNMLKTAP